MDLTGVQCVQMDLMMMLEMLHVGNQDTDDPVTSILVASMLFYCIETVNMYIEYLS